MTGSTMRSRKKSKDTWNKWKWGHNNPKSVAHRESNPERVIHSTLQAYLKKKTRKSSNKQSNFTLKRTWKITTNKAQSEHKEGNNKDQSRNNEIDSKKEKRCQRSMNPEAGSLKR